MANLEFGFGFGRANEGNKVQRSAFRILVLGDFSGNAQRATGNLKALPADPDTIDALPGRMGTTLSLALPGAEDRVALAFDHLDDFHPDRLIATVPLLAELQALRRRLLNPSTFSEAAAEVQSWSNVAEAPTAKELPTPPTAPQDAAGLMDELLGKPVTPHQGPKTTNVTSAIDRMVRDLIAPHVVPDPDPQRDSLVAAVDSVLNERLRGLLHENSFQALESVWRGLQFLVQSLELDEELSLHVLDLSREQLDTELAEAEDMPSTELHRLLVDEAVGAPGAEPWTLIVGLYAFRREDAPLLERMGRLAAEAHAVFLGGLDYSQRAPKTLEEAPADWKALRQSPAADHLVLTLPRFLLRLPYGPETDAIDAFAFEENPLPPSAARYLWGHSSLVSSCLLAQAFLDSGWAMRPGEVAELDGLPLHAFKQDGESEMTPCAEFWLSDMDADALREQGVTVVQSVRGRDAVRVEQFQTLSGKSVPIGRC